jgi:hypothetical protein
MKVSELIKRLSELNPDLKVVLYTDGLASPVTNLILGKFKPVRNSTQGHFSPSGDVNSVLLDCED